MIEIVGGASKRKIHNKTQVHTCIKPAHVYRDRAMD